MDMTQLLDEMTRILNIKLLMIGRLYTEKNRLD